MKPGQRIVTLLINLAIGFGLTWAVAKYIATPPPSGEAYRVAAGWPKLTDGIVVGQVAGAIRRAPNANRWAAIFVETLC